MCYFTSITKDYYLLGRSIISRTMVRYLWLSPIVLPYMTFLYSPGCLDYTPTSWCELLLVSRTLETVQSPSLVSVSETSSFVDESWTGTPFFWVSDERRDTPTGWGTSLRRLSHTDRFESIVRVSVRYGPRPPSPHLYFFFLDSKRHYPRPSTLVGRMCRYVFSSLC